VKGFDSDGIFQVSLFFSFGLLVISFPVEAQPQEEFKLEGTAFNAEACSGGLKTKGCSLSFALTGPAAKQLYQGMSAKAVREACTGGLEKIDSSGLRCLEYEDGTYACDYGYYFDRGEFGSSSMTC
jgi:hypothetical protein